jgi:hypothetical protein
VDPESHDATSDSHLRPALRCQLLRYQPLAIQLLDFFGRAKDRAEGLISTIVASRARCGKQSMLVPRLRPRDSRQLHRLLTVDDLEVGDTPICVLKPFTNPTPYPTLTHCEKRNGELKSRKKEGPVTYLEKLRTKLPGLASRAKTSRSAAIKLFCYDCMGGRAAEVRRCTCVTCPLHPFRPGRVALSSCDAVVLRDHAGRVVLP